jgi:Phage late-transcription coactivator
MPNEDEILSFSRMIEQFAYNESINILDAIIHYCEESTLEYDTASDLISSALKEKIRVECVDMNLIKKESSLYD